jgi:trimethylamine--corrinoid protein Co-methyltransferase
MKLALFKVLSEPEVEEIHQVTLHLLENPGIRVSDAPLRQMMAEAGCHVKGNSENVRFPAALVTELLQGVPASFEVRGLEEDETVRIGGGRMCAASGFMGCFMFEPSRRDRRPLTLRDVGQFVRLAEKLDTIDLQAVPGQPNDLDQGVGLAAAVQEMLLYTRKPLIIAPFAESDVKLIQALLSTLGGHAGAPSRWICQQSMRSPLTLPPDMAQVMRTVIPLGVPMNFHTAPQTAASAPFTLAGLIAQYNTEMVCALVSSQIIKKGAPCIYGGGWGTSDLQKLQRHLGSPEAALLRIAGAQMARFYGVPSHGIGPDTDAQSVDPRNGWEKMLSCLALVGAGTDLIINAGMFGTAMNMSLSQLVIDHEIIGAARRCSQGLLVDRERLAEEVIREAGPDCSFLGHEHTLKHMRDGEFWIPTVSRTETFPEWLERGGPSTALDSELRAQELLAGEVIPVISEEAQRALQSVLGSKK